MCQKLRMLWLQVWKIQAVDAHGSLVRPVRREMTMKRIILTAGLLVASGLFAAPRAMFAADTMSSTGTWRITGDVMGTPVNMRCMLTEADSKVSGSCAGAADNYTPHKVSGKVNAGKLEFHFETAMQGNAISVIVTGKLNDDGSKLDGELDVEPMQVNGAFTGVKEPDSGATASSTDAGAPVVVPKAPGAAMSSGTTSGMWKVNGDIQGTPVNMTCTLAEAGGKLSGTCLGASPEDTVPQKLTGDVTAKGVSWKFDTVYQGSPITLTWSGALSPDGAKMSGSMAVTPMGVDGTFTAAKQ